MKVEVSFQPSQPGHVEPQNLQVKRRRDPTLFRVSFFLGAALWILMLLWLLDGLRIVYIPAVRDPARFFERLAPAESGTSKKGGC